MLSNNIPQNRKYHNVFVGIAVNEKRIMLGARIPRLGYFVDRAKQKAAEFGRKFNVAFTLVPAVAVAG